MDSLFEEIEGARDICIDEFPAAVGSKVWLVKSCRVQDRVNPMDTFLKVNLANEVLAYHDAQVALFEQPKGKASRDS
jgi:hypothetical protein